jgi:anti-anti-sigma regulatory factor
MPDNLEDLAMIQLSGVVDVDTVEDQRDRLLELIASYSSRAVEVDLSGLKVHGTAVIALLISTVRESRKLQKEVSFKNCPEILLAVAGACGVTDILPLD